MKRGLARGRDMGAEDILSCMRFAALALFLLAGASFGAAPKRLSLELANADVHSVLRLFAEVGRFNLVTSETVSGKVTLTLRNVPWDEAMKVVLAAKGLGFERTDNIVRVAPLAELQAEAEARVRLKEARLVSAPLTTTLIPINYARASELVEQVKATLSPRGTVTVDTRTNTLIVRDVE